MTNREEEKLEAWVDYFGRQEVGGLAKTVKELQEATSDEDAAFDHLAQIILRDPALTFRVLHLANSVLFNYAYGHISTVSRAIVLLGTQPIRTICLGIKLLDTILGDNPRARLLEAVAHAFHTGAQARKLAQLMGLDSPEEVFVAGLLYRLGELVFWAYGGECADELDERLKAHPEAPQEPVREMIGANFHQLTLSLTGIWDMGELVIQANKPKRGRPSREVRCVWGGDAIAQASREGWQSRALAQELASMARATGKGQDEIKAQMLEAADEAREIASHHELQQRIRASAEGREADEAGEAGAAADAQASTAAEVSAEAGVTPGERGYGSDPELQLEVIWELTEMAAQPRDLNSIFRVVLEGLHRGIGLPRVVLAVVSSDRERIQAKYALGQGTDGWMQRFDFCNSTDNVLGQALARGHRYTHQALAGGSGDTGPIPPELRGLIRKGTFLLGPIAGGGRRVGLFYADTGESGAGLTENQYRSFNNFIRQANVCVAALVKSKSRSGGGR